MKKIQILFFTFLLCLFAADVCAQKQDKVSGKILSSLNTPVKGAVVSVTGSEDVTTDENGVFQTECKDLKKAWISVWAVGYYTVRQALDGRKDINIILIPESKYKYNETTVLPFRVETNEVTTSAENITKKDFTPASMNIDRALAGQIAGLQVTRGSGMPGEGSYMNLRGVRSFVGNNAPLVIINGIPYIPDVHNSQMINGYSRNIFQAYNINDIQNITVLKGAEAAIYGSMGANGVILIETDGATSDNMNTEISYYGQFGMSWNDKRIPLLSGIDYKSFLSDMGMNYYGNMENFFNNFPFMNDAEGKNGYLYNNNTNWQDELYRNGFVTDNLFRIEGGDNIAKYDLSLGYANEQGILKSTKQDRYHTQLNGNFLVSKNFEVYATIGLAYMNGHFQEQGMSRHTNPILAAYAQSPLLAPYQKTSNGDFIPLYSSYYYGICQDLTFAVSNPVAIVNEVDANNRQYDVNIKAGFNYRIIPGLSVDGVFGIYYNYNKEHIFMPGVSDPVIVPAIDTYGEQKNVVREGVAETQNYFYNLNARFNKVFSNRHVLNAMAGCQVLTTQNELDGAFARNTTNDFYQVLNSANKVGSYFDGYLAKWNWMNIFAHADYTYNNLLNVSANMSVDGSSANGKYTNRFRVYPSAGLTWMAKNMSFLIDKDWVNRLDLRAEYSVTGNSRFSSNYGRNYYSSLPYMAVSGIVRTQIPNTHLKPEVTTQMNLSLDAAFLRNRISLGVDYYRGRSKDVIMNVNTSAVYGTSGYYTNCAKIDNKGVELSFQASLIHLRDFEWIVGGNIAFTDNKIKSLGGYDQKTLEYSDGATVVSRVGGSPYEFYGLQADGVYATQAEADKANLVNSSMQAYQAGDVRFIDQNNDGRIDIKDRISLGSAAPDYFGGFYTNFRYRHFALSAEFAYSKGNKAYNAVRRTLESASSFSNQSVAVSNRWSVEGQVTDMPRATFGDAIGNNNFSSRWIEDASYLRIKNITLSYNFDKPIWNFFRSGTIYVTGENLLTATKYLGLDPEFAYSSSDNATQGFDYAKVMQPKSVKLGINLKF